MSRSIMITSPGSIAEPGSLVFDDDTSRNTLKYGLYSVRPALPESRSFQMPESHRGPTLKHRPQHRAEDTESLERLRQQISIRLWAHAHTHNRCAAQKFVVFGHKCCVQFVSKVTMTELEKLGIPKLNDHNYVFWHIKMRAYLVARGYSAAITNAEDANSDKALASITLAVEDHFLPTVYKAASAKAAWDALQALFQQRSVANQLNLTQELNNLTLQPGETITQLLARAGVINYSTLMRSSLIRKRIRRYSDKSGAHATGGQMVHRAPEAPQRLYSLPQRSNTHFSRLFYSNGTTKSVWRHHPPRHGP
eukprot:jgi/Chrzof1/7378/Cz02g21180.t1